MTIMHFTKSPLKYLDEYRFVAVSQTEIKPGENYKLNNLSLMAKQELESAHNSTQAAAENSFSKTQAFGEKYTPFSLTPTQQTPASQVKQNTS